MSSFKILHTESSCGWGGQELRILLEARQIVSLHPAFEVLMLVDENSKFKDFSHLSLGIRVIYEPIARKNFIALWRTLVTLRREAPDVVATHSSTDSWLVSVARKLIGCKSTLIRYRHIAAPINDNLATRWLYHQASLIITTSVDIKERVSESTKVPPEKIVSIPTGVDTCDKFKPSPRKKSNGTVILGMVSTLRSWKGHHVVLNALKYLPNCALMILGDGPQMERLKSLVIELNVESRVHFCGHIEVTASDFSSFDIFIHPSLANEGVSQALLQAAAVRLPIIATTIGGTVEVVKHRETGLLVAPGSVDEIVEAVEELIINTELAETIAKNARDYVVENHSIDRMTAEIEAAYGIL